MAIQKTTNILYILGVFCLSMGLGLILFVLYLLPFIMFDFVYDVPEFVIHLNEWYAVHHELSGLFVITGMLLPFIIGSGLFFYLSQRITSAIEHRDAELMRELEKLPHEEKHLHVQEDIKLIIIISVVSVLIILGIFFIEYLIARDVGI